MSVRIRMKRMGRTHRPFFRICAVDKRAPRDGRVLEELGTYDPSVSDTDARAKLDAERIDYWIGVGAQPSEKVAVLIKKYGKDGTHVEAQQAALEKMAQPKEVPAAGKPASTNEPGEPETAEGSASAGQETGEEAAAESAPQQESTDQETEEKAATG